MAFQSVCPDKELIFFCTYFWNSLASQNGLSEVGNGGDVRSCPSRMCLMEGTSSSAQLVLRSMSQRILRGKKFVSTTSGAHSVT